VAWTLLVTAAEGLEMGRAALTNHRCMNAIGLALVGCLVVAPAPARADSVAPPAVTSPVPSARVHIESPSVQYLLRSPDDGWTWGLACSSPCDTELPLTDVYRMGHGKKFRLNGAPGDVIELRVDPPSKGAVIGGGIASALGFLSSLVASVLLSGTEWGCSPAVPATSCNASNSAFDALAIVAGAGAAVGVAGLVVMLRGSKTDVRQGIVGPPPAGPSDTPPQPSWRVGSSPPPAGAPAFTLPVFSTSF
jgi:hypothetical protein